MKEYEKYQLQWMIDHGHSISELIDELDRCQYDWAENNETVSDIFSAWENNIGFGGEIWSCKPEWEDCEPKEYIEKIYVSEEIEKWLKEPADEFDCLGEDETIINTVTFSNGFQMDIKCCGVQLGGTMLLNMNLNWFANRVIPVSDVTKRIICVSRRRFISGCKSICA